MQLTDTFQNRVRFDLARDPELTYSRGSVPCRVSGFIFGSLDLVKYVQVQQYHVRTHGQHAWQI